MITYTAASAGLTLTVPGFNHGYWLVTTPTTKAKRPTSPWDGPWRLVGKGPFNRRWVRWLRHGNHRALVHGPALDPEQDEVDDLTAEELEERFANGEPVDILNHAGPCPACNAEWAYQHGPVPASRVRIITHLECPDCNTRFP